MLYAIAAWIFIRLFSWSLLCTIGGKDIHIRLVNRDKALLLEDNARLNTRPE